MTCATVNKGIKEAGINGKMVKGKGYYYFVGDLINIPSLYSFTLNGWTVEQIIEHIKKHTA